MMVVDDENDVNRLPRQPVRKNDIKVANFKQEICGRPGAMTSLKNSFDTGELSALDQTSVFDKGRAVPEGRLN